MGELLWLVTFEGFWKSLGSRDIVTATLSSHYLCQTLPEGKQFSSMAVVRRRSDGSDRNAFPGG